MSRPFWAEHEKTIDRDRFRASPYFLDARGYPYEAAAKVVEAWDDVEPYEIADDDAFGCETSVILFRGEPCMVSRDSLDSAMELAFLLRAAVPMTGATVLDIGAGYGRLARRIALACPGLHVYCLDRSPVAMECCQRYLAHRGVSPYWVRVVPEQQEGTLPHDADLAINVHSWSECSHAEIVEWLDALDRLRARRLFIVPHWPELRAFSTEHGGGRGESYQAALDARGWKLAAEWHQAFEPERFSKHYYLFERAG